MITQTWPPFTFYPRLINDLKNNWPANGGNHFTPEMHFKWRLAIGRFASPNLVRVKLTLFLAPFWLKVSVSPPYNAQPLLRAVMASVSHSTVHPVSVSLATDWPACANERETRSVIGQSSFNHRWEGGVPMSVWGRISKDCFVESECTYLSAWKADFILRKAYVAHECREQIRIWDRVMVWACAFRSWQHHPARGWAEEDTDCLFCHCQ